MNEYLTYVKQQKKIAINDEREGLLISVWENENEF